MPSMALTAGIQEETTHRETKFGFPKFSFTLNRRKKVRDSVVAGSKFFRERADRMVETAKVLSVTNDGMGIPHVRYELEIRKLKSVTSFSAGHRSLALDTFVTTYGLGA